MSAAACARGQRGREGKEADAWGPARHMVVTKSRGAPGETHSRVGGGGRPFAAAVAHIAQGSSSRAQDPRGPGKWPLPRRKISLHRSTTSNNGSTTHLKMEKKKAAAEGGFRCANLDCNVTGRHKVNTRCARCLAVCYCSSECQRRIGTGAAATTRPTANRR